jgi:asparagine synthase (glutamine-hydrolysing)
LTTKKTIKNQSTAFFRSNPSSHACINDNTISMIIENENICIEKKTYLPDSILWRTKEAFSDGVSNMTNPWYNIINNKIQNRSIDSKNYPINNNNLTLEQEYYLSIFLDYFPLNQDIIPYYWMPRYTDAIDSSARTLSFYNVSNTNISNS